MGRPRKIVAAHQLRTKEVIDNEYGQHAAQAGHKAGLIMELEAQIEALRNQIETHLAQQGKLRKEHFAVPAASTPTAVPPLPVEPATATA